MKMMSSPSSLPHKSSSSTLTYAITITIGALYGSIFLCIASNQKVIASATFENTQILYLVFHVLLFITVIMVIYSFKAIENSQSTSLTRILAQRENQIQLLQNQITQQQTHFVKLESNAAQRSLKSSAYLNQLIEISRMEELHTGRLRFAIQAIQRSIMKAMMLDSFCIWEFDEKEHQLVILESSGLSDQELRQANRISPNKFRETFDLLESGAIITSGTNNLSDRGKLSFLNLGEKKSAVACPYFIDGKFAGFFCCTGIDREWCSEDVLFLLAISDALPLAFKSHEQKLHKQVLVDKQREIIELNASLEQKVLDRTRELNIRNKQLTDFAFMNAHQIRGPICRLLGLKGLLLETKDPDEIVLLGKYMATSIEDLNEITHRATALLSEELPM